MADLCENPDLNPFQAARIPDGMLLHLPIQLLSALDHLTYRPSCTAHMASQVRKRGSVEEGE